MLRRIIIILTLSLLASQINGQFLQSLKEKVKDKTKDRIEQKIDEGIDKTLDGTEDALSGSDEDIEDEEMRADVESNEMKTSAVVKQQDLKTYSKFDFIPGEEVIFFDDFSDVPIGDFPLQWNTTSSAEVVTVNNAPGKWLKLMSEFAYYSPELKVSFPENFTIEFDAIYTGNVDWLLEIYQNNSDYLENGYVPGDAGMSIRFIYEEIVIGNYSNVEEKDDRGQIGQSFGKEINPGEVIRYSIWGQNQRLRVYVNDAKVIDIPRAIPKKYDLNYMRIGCMDAFILGNFRVAVGAPDTRSRLITEGKLVTRGITFDSGSDVIKPESFGILKEIADVLKENSSVRIKIVGHTDSDGADDMNLTLSKKRAAAVKNALSKQFGIDASRMETDGMGESQPVSSNSTPEGKANNRRVEFIKL